MMHGARPGYPQGYYGGPQHAGHMRPPTYHHMPQSNPSFQSMTSHWNLPPNPMPHPAGSPYHHHMPPPPPPPVSSSMSGSGGGGGGGGSSSKSKYAHLGQYGLTMDPPKPPEKPLLPYMRYSRKKWVELKADTTKVWEVQTVGKLIGQMWREMSDEEKQPYCDEYEREKLVYNEQMKVYKNSPAYKRWMDAKAQAEAAREAALQAAAAASSSSAASSQFHPDYAAPHSVLPRHPHTDPRIMIQQQQQMEEEEDQYITKKQMAAMRYHRNHRLMHMLFDEVPVPDSRYVVDRKRYQTLKNQVQSLHHHQKKLESEVVKIDGQYESKKRKFLEDSEQFRRELKKIQDNPPTSWKKPTPPVIIIDLPQPSKDAKYKQL